MTGTLPSDELTLWEILGVSEDANTATVDLAWRGSEKTPEQRYAWKALRSPYYGPCYRAYRTTAALYDAGFFDDGLDYDILTVAQTNPMFITTDLSKVKRWWDVLQQNIKHEDYQPKRAPVVLLNTGGYSPLHDGHVSMMNEARNSLVKAGYDVLGGFFSPGHDSYVDNKAKGSAKCHIAARISAAEHIIRDSDWLAIDPWAGYYLDQEINFTDVIVRLQAYLRHHIDPTIQVVYVFGSDNQGFSYAFLERGQAVCVKRIGYPITFNPNEIPNVTISGFEISNVSSTGIRDGELYYDQLAMQQYLQEVVISHPRYLIRDEKDLAISQWFRGRDPDVVRGAAQKLLATLQGAIKGAFADQVDMAVDVLDVELQRRLAKELVGKSKTISMDVFFKGDHNVNLSRAFELASAQKSSKEMVQRPGTAPLEMWDLAPGEYILVEDDVASGATMRNVKSMLPNDVKISRELIMSHFDGIANDEGSEFYDIVDLRDFIVGSKHGGLVCYLPNERRTTRVPYLLPYVSLRARAFIPAAKEKDVAIAMWKANIAFFEEIGDSTIGETFSAFAEFAEFLGWHPGHSMVDFCNWHVKMLSDQTC